jgi:hypothetical protein
MKSYYNRENMVTSLGFDNLYFIEKMEEKGYTNYIEKYGLGVKKILDEIVTEGNDITIKPFKGTKPQQQKQNTVTINGKEYKDISSTITNPPLAIGQEFVLDDETYEVATYLQDASGI